MKKCKYIQKPQLLELRTKNLMIYYLTKNQMKLYNLLLSTSIYQMKQNNKCFVKKSAQHKVIPTLKELQDLLN